MEHERALGRWLRLTYGEFPHRPCSAARTSHGCTVSGTAGCGRSRCYTLFPIDRGHGATAACRRLERVQGRTDSRASANRRTRHAVSGQACAGHDRSAREFRQGSELTTPATWLACAATIGCKDSSHRLQPYKLPRAATRAAPVDLPGTRFYASGQVALAVRVGIRPARRNDMNHRVRVEPKCRPPEQASASHASVRPKGST